MGPLCLIAQGMMLGVRDFSVEVCWMASMLVDMMLSCMIAVTLRYFWIIVFEQPDQVQDDATATREALSAFRSFPLPIWGDANLSAMQIHTRTLSHRHHEHDQADLFQTTSTTQETQLHHTYRLSKLGRSRMMQQWTSLTDSVPAKRSPNAIYAPLIERRGKLR